MSCEYREVIIQEDGTTLRMILQIKKVNSSQEHYGTLSLKITPFD